MANFNFLVTSPTQQAIEMTREDQTRASDHFEQTKVLLLEQMQDWRVGGSVWCNILQTTSKPFHVRIARIAPTSAAFVFLGPNFIAENVPARDPIHIAVGVLVAGRDTEDDERALRFFPHEYKDSFGNALPLAKDVWERFGTVKRPAIAVAVSRDALRGDPYFMGSLMAVGDAFFTLLDGTTYS